MDAHHGLAPAPGPTCCFAFSKHLTTPLQREAQYTTHAKADMPVVWLYAEAGRVEPRACLPPSNMSGGPTGRSASRIASRRRSRSSSLGPAILTVTLVGGASVT